MMSRVRSDKTSPAIDDVDNLTTEVVQIWANELSIDIVRRMTDPVELESLIVFNKELSLSAGSVNLPDDYAYYIGVKPETTFNGVKKKRPARVFENPSDFAAFDNSSFSTTPPKEYPQALIASGKIRVNPESATKLFFDYYKVHPTISSSQDTIWSDSADNVLVELLMAKYYESHDDVERQALSLQEAERIITNG
jgi:hypothetical protein